MPPPFAVNISSVQAMAAGQVLFRAIEAGGGVFARVSPEWELQLDDRLRTRGLALGEIGYSEIVNHLTLGMDPVSVVNGSWPRPLDLRQVARHMSSRSEQQHSGTVRQQQQPQPRQQSRRGLCRSE